MDDKAVDPVCGMTVVPSSAFAALEHEGRVYYFCSAGCQQRFQENPAQYVRGDTPSPAGRSEEEEDD